MRKSDAMKALSKAQAETQLWKSRYETEGMGRIEELEGARAKLQAKIVENEELVDVLQTKALSKAQAEIQLWKSRYEIEGMGRIEELEGARAKLQAKIVENEEPVDVLQTKVANAEKSK